MSGLDNKLTTLQPLQNQPMTILQAPTRLAGGVLMGLAGLTAVWAFIAPIPVKVQGLGVLTPIDSLFSVKSPGSGSVIYPFKRIDGKVKFISPSWGMRTYDYLEDPSSLTNVELEKLVRIVIDDMAGYSSIRVPFSKVTGGKGTGADTVQVQPKTLLAFVENAAAKTDLITKLQTLTESTALYEEIKHLQKQSLENQEKVADARLRMLMPLEELVKKGYSSKLEYINAQATAATTNTQTLQGKQALNEVSRKITTNRASLRTSFAQFLRASTVYSNDYGYIKSVIRQQWENVQVGADLMVLSWSKQVSPNTIPVFLNQQDATMIAVGMPTISTPLGFSPSEVGGIKGRITSVEALPYTTQTISSRLNSPGIAQIVSRGGAAYQVNVTLERTGYKTLSKIAKSRYDPRKDLKLKGNATTNQNMNSRGGYVWNNKSNPPNPPRDGFILATQITTRNRTPIQMLIPAFKEYSGFATPHKLQLLDLQE